MKCNNCGAELVPGAKFCTECGTPVALTETAVNEAVRNAGSAVESAAEVQAEKLDAAEESIENIESAASSKAEEIAAATDEVISGSDESVVQTAQTAAEDVSEPVAEAISEPVAEAVSDAARETVETQIVEPVEPVEPVVPAAPAAEIPVNSAVNNVKPAKQSKRLPHQRSGAAHFFAVLLSILLCVIMFVTMVVAVLQFSLSESAAESVLKKADLGNVKIDDVLTEKQIRDLGFEIDTDGLTILEFVYENIDQDLLSVPLEKDQFMKIAESDEFREFIALTFSKRASEIVDGLQTHEKVNLIDINEIFDFLHDKRRFLSDTLDYDLTDERIDEIKAMLLERFGKAIETLKIEPMSKNLSSGVASAIKLLFSTWVLIVLIAVCVLLVVLIFLVIHSWRLGLRYNGIVFMIVGFPFLVLGAFLPIIVTAVSGLLDTTVAIVSVVANILSAFTGIFLILGGAVFGVGLIAFIVSLIIGSRQHKKYAKAL